MNIKIIILLSLFCITLLINGCNSEQSDIEEVIMPDKQEESTSVATKNTQLSQPPELIIVYNDNNYLGVKGTYSWTIDNSNGSFQGIEVDSGPPHDLVKYQKQKIKVKPNDVFEITFRSEPSRYTVKIWNDFDNTEEVEYDESNKIIVPEGSGNITFYVHAFWGQGNAHYAFRLSLDEK